MLGSSRSRFWIKCLNTNVYYGGDSKRCWGNIGIWSRERAQDNKLILSTSLSLWATEVLTWSGTLNDCRLHLRDGSAEGWGSWTILPSHQSSVESFSKEHKDSGIPHLPCTHVKTVRKPLGDESRVCALGHLLCAGQLYDKDICAGHWWCPLSGRHNSYFWKRIST